MTKLFDILPASEREKIKKGDQPDWIHPMLATLTDKRFSDENWLYERKFDGERCVAYKKGKEIHLMSRNKKEMNGQYPEIVDALSKEQKDFIVDGEIVAFEGNLSSFSKLQKRMHRKRPDMSISVFYYTFDLLHFEGYSLDRLDLRHRKSLLKEHLDYSSDTIRYTTHRVEEGEDFLKEACRKGWEGLIAKDMKSRYVHNRSRKWLKFKCENQQELIICGYTEPEGQRQHFGALLVGFYKGDELHYAGKVGTGYDDETLEMLHEKMKPLEMDKPPFDNDKPKEKKAHWLKPKLVGQFQFTEWTGDDKLRHPSYLGLRDDKKPKEVKQEKTKS